MEVLRAALIRRDEREVEIGLRDGRQLALGLLRRFLEPLEGHRVLREVDPLVLQKLIDHPVDHALVEVISTQVRIAVRGLHLEHPVSELEYGDVVRPSTEVEHGDLFVALLVETVGQSGRGGLVDDSEYVEPGDLAGVLGGLPLRIVEVSRDRDHCLADIRAQVILGRLLHFLQHHGRDLRRRERLVAMRDLHLDSILAVALDLVRDQLPLVIHLGALPTHESLDR